MGIFASDDAHKNGFVVAHLHCLECPEESKPEIGKEQKKGDLARSCSRQSGSTAIQGRKNASLGQQLKQLATGKKKTC